MKIYKDSNNKVHKIEVGFESLLPSGSVVITQAEADILLAPPAPTKDEIIAGISAALQNVLDVDAQAAGYDNINTIVSYADEPSVPTFQKEGQSFRAWRSKVWAHAYTELATFEAAANQYLLDVAQYDVDKTQYDIDKAQWGIDVAADPTLVEPIAPTKPTTPIQPTEQSMVANMPKRVV